MRIFTPLLSALTLLATISAHGIQLYPHARECFFEELHKGDRMSVSYQVSDREFGSSGSLEIDFWVPPLPSCSGEERQLMDMRSPLWSSSKKHSRACG